MPTPVQFSSQYSELRLIRRPAEERILANGAVAVVAPEIVLEFKEHMFFTAEGRNVLPDLWDEDKAAFVDQDELSWMRTHEGYDSLFHEIPEEVPDSAELTREIARLAAVGDREALMELGRTEVETHNRPEVLDLLKEVVQTMPDGVPSG